MCAHTLALAIAGLPASEPSTCKREQATGTCMPTYMYNAYDRARQRSVHIRFADKYIQYIYVHIKYVLCSVNFKHTSIFMYV